METRKLLSTQQQFSRICYQNQKSFSTERRNIKKFLNVREIEDFYVFDCYSHFSNFSSY